MPAAASPLLRANALSKRFGARQALAEVSFRAERGEIFGILGSNGAGKSTLVGILAGLLEADEGEVEIFGESFARNRAAILARMNIASPYAALPGQLTVRQNLAIYADLYGVARPGLRIAQLLDLFGIATQAETRFARLSSGQAVLACLCKALLNAPELLLLDEPTAHLDPELARRTRALLAEERSAHGATILLTSHNLAEIEELCDRLLILSRGRVIAQGSALAVTQAILGRERREAALAEVFARLTQSASARG